MIFFNKSRKAQSAMEFVVVLAFSLVVLAALLVIFQNRLSTMEENREKIVVDQMFNLVMSEIDLAIMSPPVYTRTFYLPRTLDGYPYTIEIIEDIDVVIDYRGVTHVRFLTGSTGVIGSFKVGKNTIVKNSDGDILLN